MPVIKREVRNYYDVEDLKAGVTIQDVLDANGGVDVIDTGGVEWHSKCCCPTDEHDDDKPSFCYSDEAFCCHSHAEEFKGDIITLYKKLFNVEDSVAFRELAKLGNIAPLENTHYIYQDESGHDICRKCKTPDKIFWQEVWEGGKWVRSNSNNKKQLLYNLPELVQKPGKACFIVEGEKDAETLKSHGFLATTTLNGFQANFISYFVNRDIIIIPDNDVVGRQKADKLVNLLYQHARVRLIKLPDLKDKEDVTDWFNKGGTGKALKIMVNDAEHIDSKTKTDVEIFIEHSYADYIKNDKTVFRTESPLSDYICYTDTLTLFAGEPAGGKTTFIAYEIYKAIQNKMRVLWISGLTDETPRKVVNLITGFGLTDEEAKNLLIPTFESTGEKALSCDMMLQLKQDVQPDIIVFDSLISTLPAFLNEKAIPPNSATSEWNALIAKYYSVYKDATTSVVIIHHTAKQKFDDVNKPIIMGSQGILAAGDLKMTYYTPKDDQKQTQETLRVLYRIGRIREIEQEITFKFNLTNYTTYRAINVSGRKTKNAADWLCHNLLGKGPVSALTLLDEGEQAGHNKNTLLKATKPDFLMIIKSRGLSNNTRKTWFWELPEAFEKVSISEDPTVNDEEKEF